MLDDLSARADELLAGAPIDGGARSRLREVFRFVALTLGERGESSPALVDAYATWTLEGLATVKFEGLVAPVLLEVRGSRACPIEPVQ